MRDYKEQIDALRWCSKYNSCEGCPFSPKCLDDVQGMLASAANAIAELLAAVPTWISVEERLPDKNYAVIGYCVGNGCIFTVYHDGEKWRHFSQRTDPVFYPVTHWMPIPSPPKEETE